MRFFARIVAVTGSLLVLVLIPFRFASAQGINEVTIAIEPADMSVVLGGNVDLAITVTNTGSAPTEPLVVHLDITDPAQSTSVDPEDWTATLSKPIGVVAAGATTTVDWTIQPISGGSFAVYAVALSSGVDTTTVSNVAQVQVADQRSLNPGGILPVALGAPAVVGALLLAQLRMARRTAKMPATPALN